MMKIHRIEKTLITPGTFYAHLKGGQKEFGSINSPMWIVDKKTGMLQETKPGEASFIKEIYPENYQGQMVEYIIITLNAYFSVDDKDDVFNSKFKSVTQEAMNKGLCRTLKGNYILFLDQQEAAKEAYKILMRRKKKIEEEIELAKYLNSNLNYV